MTSELKDISPFFNNLEKEEKNETKDEELRREYMEELNRFIDNVKKMIDELEEKHKKEMKEKNDYIEELKEELKKNKNNN